MAPRGRGGAGGRAAMRLAAALLAVGCAAALSAADVLLVRGEPLLREAPAQQPSSAGTVHETPALAAAAADADAVSITASDGEARAVAGEPAPVPQPLLSLVDAQAGEPLAHDGGMPCDDDDGAEADYDAAMQARLDAEFDAEYEPPWWWSSDEAPDDAEALEALGSESEGSEGVEFAPLADAVSTEEDQLLERNAGADGWDADAWVARATHRPRRGPATAASLAAAHAAGETTDGLMPALPARRARMDVDAMADATPGGDNAAVAAAVLAAISPAAAALAADAAVGGVAVSVQVSQQGSLERTPDGGLALRHEWHVSTSADVAPAYADPALLDPQPALWSTAAGLMRLRDAAAPLVARGGAATAQLSAQLHAAARAQQDVYPLPDDAPADDSTDSSDNSELIALMMAAGAFDGSVGVLARGPWRAPKFDFGFDLDDDELQRAAGFACLATLCIFMGVLLGRYMYEPEEEVEEEVDEEAGACKAAEKDEGTSKSCGTDDDGAATARAHGGATRAGDDGGADYHALPALPYSVA